MRKGAFLVMAARYASPQRRTPLSYLAGGELRSELHRVNMGMGIDGAHRRQGGGTLLLESAIAWARGHAGIDWIDLGGFSDNQGAQALYQRLGFVLLGWTPDRYRVDGSSLGDTATVLNVAQSPAVRQ